MVDESALMPTFTPTGMVLSTFGAHVVVEAFQTASGRKGCVTPWHVRGQRQAPCCALQILPRLHTHAVPRPGAFPRP